jgi:8-oxo-dGTP diphosphatase
MKSINVVAAIMHRNTEDNVKQIFTTQRGYGDFKDGWEFPGGKIEPNEAPETAIVREIEEELDTEIIVEKEIGTIEYDYPTFHISMKCFWCSIKSGELKLLEHEDAKWISLEEIDSVDWLPADREILPKIKEFLK